jgi:hypothetical protein
MLHFCYHLSAERTSERLALAYFLATLHVIKYAEGFSLSTKTGSDKTA